MNYQPKSIKRVDITPPSRKKTKSAKKPDPNKKDGLERTVWMGLIAACVVGVGLCVALIPAFSDEPFSLIVLGVLFAGAAFAAGKQL